MDVDLTTLDDEELVALNQQLGREQDAIRAQRIAINEERTKREHSRQAAALLEGVDPNVLRIVVENAAGLKMGGKEVEN
jgi:hypothetical protein